MAWTAVVSDELFPIADKLKEIGYDGVECLIGSPEAAAYQRFGAHARQTGLEVTSVFVVGKEENPISEQASVRARALDRIKWAIDRGTGSLYAGAIITALAAPGIVNALGYDVDGLGTFCFGVAFVFIGAVRAASGGGVGWQLWFGGLLMLLGGVNMITPEIGGLIVPLALLILGAVLVFGGAGRRTSP